MAMVMGLKLSLIAEPKAIKCLAEDNSVFEKASSFSERAHGLQVRIPGSEKNNNSILHC